MEHHYTESLGHDDIKFYPLAVTSGDQEQYEVRS